jgi:CheY-like chemotaxis protein
MITVKAVLAEGYNVIEATNGREGVELAKKHLPDLILMDIALPEMDGIEAFKTIRKDVRLQQIPVIALTASALTEDRELILAHGFNAFIAKPIDENIFFSTLKATLYGE